MSGRFTQESLDWFVALLRDTHTMRNDIKASPRLFSPLRGLNERVLLPAALLASIRSPAFFLWGDADPNGGADVARAFVEQIPDAQLELMAGVGHAPWMDDPDHAARDHGVRSFGAKGRLLSCRTSRATVSSIYYEQTGHGPGHRVGRRRRHRRQGLATVPDRVLRSPHTAARCSTTAASAQTRCDAALPWPLADFATDLAELVQAVCDGPVAFVGSSLGSAIVQEVRHRSSRVGALRGRDGQRRVEHRLGLGLPGGRDRVPPAGRDARRDDGRRPLRGDAVSGAGAGRP